VWFWVSVILVAALAAGGAGFAWQRAEIGERDDALAAAIDDNEQAQAEIVAFSARVDRLGDRLAAGVTGNLDLRRRLRATERRLEEAREEFLAVAGPPLGDGRHFGRLYAVGAAQEPPRLIIDIQQWFTDQAAVDAAIEDGITVDPGINGYYIRNESPRWRTVEVAPGTQVMLTISPYGTIEHPGVVSFERFSTLFTSDDMPLQWFPYWITVRDGKIVEIEEQYIP
jgi:hypothetical protein